METYGGHTAQHIRNMCIIYSKNGKKDKKQTLPGKLVIPVLEKEEEPGSVFITILSAMSFS